MEKKQKFIINAAYYTVILVILYIAWRYLVPVLMPFIIALIVAAVLVKPAGWIAGKLHINRKPVVFALVTLFYILVFWGVSAGGNRLIALIRNFIAGLPSLYNNQIRPTLEALFAKLEDLMDTADPLVVEQVESGFTSLTDSAESMISSISVTIVRLISDFVTGVPALVVRIVVTVVATFFIAGDYDRVCGFFARLLPEKWLTFCVNIKNYTINVIFVYIRSYLLLMLITFAELTVGLWILKIPYAVWIALGIAVFDALPILGTGGILLPWTVIAALLGAYKMAGGILILYLVVTAVRNTLEPRIVGRQIGLPPLVTLIALFAGMSLFGLVGLIGFPVLLSAMVGMEKDGIIHLKLFSKEKAS